MLDSVEVFLRFRIFDIDFLNFIKYFFQEPIRDPFIRIEGDSKYPIWEGIVNNFSDPLSRSQVRFS